MREIQIVFNQGDYDMLLALGKVPRYTINRVGMMFFESGTFVTPILQIQTILKYRLDGYQGLSQFSYLLEKGE